MLKGLVLAAPRLFLGDLLPYSPCDYLPCFCLVYLP
jgi:hypothetical protein